MVLPVDNWRRTLRKAWSMRLIVLAALLSGVEVAVPYLDGILPIPRGVFAMLSAVVTCAAGAARLIAQRSMQDDPAD